MGKKVKDGAKKKKKVTDESKRVTEDKPVKSIADLFETSLTDPALEALFKPNVLEHFQTLTLGCPLVAI